MAALIDVPIETPEILYICRPCRLVKPESSRSVSVFWALSSPACSCSRRCDVVLRFVHDDAFYYFGVARGWDRLGFPTFDGIDATNGYHPLWQWLLDPVPGFFRPGAFARDSASGVLFFGVGTWLIVRRLAREANPFGALAYAWVAGTLLLATIYGMESPLAVLLLALGLRRPAPSGRMDGVARAGVRRSHVAAVPDSSRCPALARGARCRSARCSARRNHRRILPLVGLIGAVQFVAVGGYFLGNWWLWGHLLSISAALKAARAPLFSLAVPRSLLFLLAVGVAGLGLLPLADFLRAFRHGLGSRV